MSLHEGRESDASEWSERIERFWDEHAAKWLPAFMVKTVAAAAGHPYDAEYAALARVGLTVLDCVREDVDRRR